MSGPHDAGQQRIYWHRDLPPVRAEIMDEHVVEAASLRVPGVFVVRDEAWQRCHDDLIAQTHARIEQELARLGGHYAHVLDESIDSRHDDTTGEAWLHGQFTYVMYRDPGAPR